MKSETSSVPYSFSMVNLINLMPEWSWQRFDEIMNQAQTKNVELVPGMVLGAEWDQYITKETLENPGHPRDNGPVIAG
jgi:hypothetical protein